MDNCIHYEVWDEITYPAEDWEWMINFIIHFSGYVITYPCY